MKMSQLSIRGFWTESRKDSSVKSKSKNQSRTQMDNQKTRDNYHIFNAILNPADCQRLVPHYHSQQYICSLLPAHHAAAKSSSVVDLFPISTHSSSLSSTPCSSLSSSLSCCKIRSLSYDKIFPNKAINLAHLWASQLS